MILFGQFWLRIGFLLMSIVSSLLRRLVWLRSWKRLIRMHRLQLLSHVRSSGVFYVKHLIPFVCDSSSQNDIVSDSRTNLSCPRGNDAEWMALTYMQKLNQLKHLTDWCWIEINFCYIKWLIFSIFSNVNTITLNLTRFNTIRFYLLFIIYFVIKLCWWIYYAGHYKMQWIYLLF